MQAATHARRTVLAAAFALILACASHASEIDPARGALHADAGDRLRVVVFGQDGLQPYAPSTAPQDHHAPDRQGGARLITSDLSSSIVARLKGGYIREPHVAVEVESYRPFFILGEVDLRPIRLCKRADGGIRDRGGRPSARGR